MNHREIPGMIRGEDGIYYAKETCAQQQARELAKAMKRYQTEPARLIVAIEVAPDEAEDLMDALNFFFFSKAPTAKFNIMRVELEDEDGPQDKGN